MTMDERQSLYRKIGYEIVLEINKVSVVTPFSLVAAVILSHDRRGISYNDLLNILNEFYEYLSVKKVKFAETFAQSRKSDNGRSQYICAVRDLSRKLKPKKMKTKKCRKWFIR